jgi:hypothetical protein
MRRFVLERADDIVDGSRANVERIDVSRDNDCAVGPSLA